MTETFRPCELFALRWSGFDMDRRTLTVSQTAFLGQAAQLRRDHEVVAHGASPTRLANELWLWKQECPDASPHAFIFPNSRKRNGATKNGFIRTNNHCVRVPKNLAEEVQLKKLNFQVLRRTIATLAQTNGSVRDVQGILAHTKADTTANVYIAADRRGREADAGCDLCRVDGSAKSCGGIVKGKNLVPLVR